MLNRSYRSKDCSNWSFAWESLWFLKLHTAWVNMQEYWCSANVVTDCKGIPYVGRTVPCKQFSYSLYIHFCMVTQRCNEVYLVTVSFHTKYVTCEHDVSHE